VGGSRASRARWFAGALVFGVLRRAEFGGRETGRRDRVTLSDVEASAQSLDSRLDPMPEGSRPAVDLSFLHRYYFDANTWDLIATHPEREGVLRHVSEPAKRTALASIVNAIELLRTPDSRKEKRVLLCQTLDSAITDDLPLVGHPMYVLEQAAKSFRSGEPTALIAEDEDDSRGLRILLRRSAELDLKESEKMKNWIEKKKTTLEGFWKEISNSGIRDRNLLVSDDFLGREDVVQLLATFSPSTNLGLSHDEIRALLQKTPIWPAFAFGIAAMLELVNQQEYSKRRPNGPDLLQVTYLGLVNEFVTDDAEFRKVACRVEELLRAACGYEVTVRPAHDFFLDIGFPLSSRG